MSLAAIVLTGGASRRMGSDKATLAWGSGTMLEAVVAAAREVVDGPVVVVHAPGRPPNLDVHAQPDPPERVGEGPLGGVLTGLEAAARAGAGRAFLLGCDMPRAAPATLRALASELGEDVALVPRDGEGRGHALGSIVDVRWASARAAELFAAGERRLRVLFEDPAVRRVDAGELPNGDSLADIDTREDFERERPR